MMTPGCAPLTPLSNEPVVSTAPSLNSLVASPKYQTLPSRSCAYQSKVSSSGSLSTVTASWTTTVSTPMTFLMSRVTSVVVRCSPSGVAASEIVRVPGVSGKYGLSTLVVKADATIVGAYGSVIFIGPGGGAEAETEALGAADVLALGGAEGPLEQAALAAKNTNAALVVRSQVLTSIA